MRCSIRVLHGTRKCGTVRNKYYRGIRARHWQQYMSFKREFGGNWNIVVIINISTNSTSQPLETSLPRTTEFFFPSESCYTRCRPFGSLVEQETAPFRKTNSVVFWEWQNKDSLELGKATQTCAQDQVVPTHTAKKKKKERKGRTNFSETTTPRDGIFSRKPLAIASVFSFRCSHTSELNPRCSITSALNIQNVPKQIFARILELEIKIPAQRRCVKVDPPPFPRIEQLRAIPFRSKAGQGLTATRSHAFRWTHSLSASSRSRVHGDTLITRSKTPFRTLCPTRFVGENRRERILNPASKEERRFEKLPPTRGRSVCSTKLIMKIFISLFAFCYQEGLLRTPDGH